MQMTDNIIVLAEKRWALTDEQTKERKEGCKIWYLMGSDTALRQNFRGHEIMSSSFPVEQFGKLPQVPCWCACTFDITVGARGQMLMKPVALDFIEAFSLAPEVKK